MSCCLLNIQGDKLRVHQHYEPAEKKQLVSKRFSKCAYFRCQLQEKQSHELLQGVTSADGEVRSRGREERRRRRRTDSITGRDIQVPCGAASIIKNGCCVREFD